MEQEVEAQRQVSEVGDAVSVVCVVVQRSGVLAVVFGQCGGKWVW